MAETQADILRHAAGFYPIQVAVADAMMAGADALEEVTRLRVETAKLRSHLFRADPHHEQAVQQALDQTTPQEVERLYCTACGYGLKPGTPDGGHNPNCPWLADARRDGTEGRQ